jgi:hypothetical protein
MSTEQPVPEPPKETPQTPDPEPAPPDWFKKIPYDPTKGNYTRIVPDGLEAIRIDGEADGVEDHRPEAHA